MAMTIQQLYMPQSLTLCCEKEHICWMSNLQHKKSLKSENLNPQSCKSRDPEIPIRIFEFRVYMVVCQIKGTFLGVH